MSTSTSEAGRPSTTAGKDTKRVKSDARHPTYFHTTMNNIAVIVHQRNNVLKKLVGSTLGCNNEILLTTYQAIGRSVLRYCFPVWTLSLMDTNWSWLQGRKIWRWELPLAVSRWQISPNCIKRLWSYQFASITN